MSILQFLPVPGNILYFQQSGSFIVPRGISTVVLIACGGGGGYGTGGSGLEGFGGGGAGGLMVGRVFGGQVIPFTIGAGGTSVASGSTGDGGPGGDTTIAGFTLGGGQGGGQDTGGAGGQISGGYFRPLFFFRAPPHQAPRGSHRRGKIAPNFNK